MSNKKKILVIGAGMGGLVAAYYLQKKGHDVEVFEASNRAGGRMRTLEYKGDKVEVGAQFFHSGYSSTLKLMDEMGLSDEIHPFDADMLFHLEDGSVFRFNQNKPFLPMLGILGNIKLVWLLIKYVIFGKKFPMYKINTDIPEYDNKKATSIVEGACSEKLTNYFMEPLLLGPPGTTSKYNVVRWLRCSVKEKLFALTGGMAQLTDAVAKRLSIRYQSPVKKVLMEKGKVVGIELVKNNEKIFADHVVLAAEPPEAAKLLPDELEIQRTFYQKVVPTKRTMPIFFMNSTLDNKYQGCFAHLNKPSLRQDVTYIFNHTVKSPWMVPSGKTILAAWFGVRAREDWFDKSDEEIIKKSILEMERMIPGFSEKIEHAEVIRYPYVETEYEPGAHKRVLDVVESMKDLQGISFVGGVFGGCFIEAAAISAEDAVEAIG